MLRKSNKFLRVGRTADNYFCKFFKGNRTSHRRSAYDLKEFHGKVQVPMMQIEHLMRITIAHGSIILVSC